MSSSKAEVDIAEIKGLLVGIKTQQQNIDKKMDMQAKDISHIKNNDKEKLQRIAKIEIESKLLDKWKEKHTQSSEDNKKEISMIKQDFNEYVNSEIKWRVGMVIAILLALFDLITRFMT